MHFRWANVVPRGKQNMRLRAWGVLRVATVGKSSRPANGTFDAGQKKNRNCTREKSPLGDGRVVPGTTLKCSSNGMAPIDRLPRHQEAPCADSTCRFSGRQSCSTPLPVLSFCITELVLTPRRCPKKTEAIRCQATQLRSDGHLGRASEPHSASQCNIVGTSTTVPANLPQQVPRGHQDIRWEGAPKA